MFKYSNAAVIDSSGTPKYSKIVGRGSSGTPNYPKVEIRELAAVHLNTLR